MTKNGQIFKWISFGGIGVYLAHCVHIAADDKLRAPLWDYLGLGYTSSFGVILVLAIFGLITLAISHHIKKRKVTGLQPISGKYTISFIVSYIPYVLLLLYSLYCSKFGFTFFTTSYGWEGFYSAFIIMGFVFCVIPVLPFCIFWQILYIVKWVRSRKAKQEKYT